MKVVGLEKLNNFHVGSFSSCFGKSKVILEILICSNSKFGISPIWDLKFKLFCQIRHFSTQNWLWSPKEDL
jgi:hypothetical protein